MYLRGRSNTSEQAEHKSVVTNIVRPQMPQVIPSSTRKIVIESIPSRDLLLAKSEAARDDPASSAQQSMKTNPSTSSDNAVNTADHGSGARAAQATQKVAAMKSPLSAGGPKKVKQSKTTLPPKELVHNVTEAYKPGNNQSPASIPQEAMTPPPAASPSTTEETPAVETSPPISEILMPPPPGLQATQTAETEPPAPEITAPAVETVPPTAGKSKDKRPPKAPDNLPNDNPLLDPTDTVEEAMSIPCNTLSCKGLGVLNSHPLLYIFLLMIISMLCMILRRACSRRHQRDPRGEYRSVSRMLASNFDTDLSDEEMNYYTSDEEDGAADGGWSRKGSIELGSIGSEANDGLTLEEMNG